MGMNTRQIFISFCKSLNTTRRIACPTRDIAGDARRVLT